MATNGLGDFCFLGFMINTHNMTIVWPRDKREALFELITIILNRKQKGRPLTMTPTEIAQVIGIVQSAAEVAPWGFFLSFNLDNTLTAASRKGYLLSKIWWKKYGMIVPKSAIATMHQLLETLLDDTLWTRPIVLYLLRDHTHVILSNASYIGIGGWSSDFGYLWRLTRNDMSLLGFNLKTIAPMSSEPIHQANPGLHINPLEYIACLINLWISLKIIMTMGPIDGGYIISLLSDNTSALSWLSYASRTPDPFIQSLARLGAVLLVEAERLHVQVDPSHIPGSQNTEAGALS